VPSLLLEQLSLGILETNGFCSSLLYLSLFSGSLESASLARLVRLIADLIGLLLVVGLWSRVFDSLEGVRLS